MWNKDGFVMEELQAFNDYLIDKYKSNNKFLNDVSQKVMLSGGKRLRPALVIISGMMDGYDSYDRKKIFPLAAAIETLHTATLVHDDIIDNAKTRRGQITVSEKHGINIAVYTGDYLISNSILLLAESGLSTEKLDRVAKAARMICAGEVSQYLNRYKLTSVSEYLKRVMKKTGILFSASCALGAYASNCSEKHVNIMGRVGMNIGVAFQIRDDLIDIELDKAKAKKAGKPVANDIRSGIVTLPFLFSANRSETIKKSIEQLFRVPSDLSGAYNTDNVGEITNISEITNVSDIKQIILDVIKAGGADAAKALKERYIQKSRNLLSTLPLVSNEAKQAIEEVLDWL